MFNIHIREVCKDNAIDDGIYTVKGKNSLRVNELGMFMFTFLNVQRLRVNKRRLFIFTFLLGQCVSRSCLRRLQRYHKNVCLCLRFFLLGQCVTV